MDSWGKVAAIGVIRKLNNTNFGKKYQRCGRREGQTNLPKDFPWIFHHGLSCWGWFWDPYQPSNCMWYFGQPSLKSLHDCSKDSVSFFHLNSINFYLNPLWLTIEVSQVTNIFTKSQSISILERSISWQHCNPNPWANNKQPYIGPRCYQYWCPKFWTEPYWLDSWSGWMTRKVVDQSCKYANDIWKIQFF